MRGNEFMPGETPHDSTHAFLMDVYRHLPVMVVQLTVDGLVLRCNPATTAITGYAEEELVGRNIWGKLFPGRLFRQVPKFVSPVAVGLIIGRDVPMTIRTKDGYEKVVGWTRFGHDGVEGAAKTTICLGVDLTDRLMASDVADAAIGVGDVGTVEGDVVMPIAITPPKGAGMAADAARAEAVEKVHGFLTEMEGQLAALETAFSRGEMRVLARVADDMAQGAHACGLLEFSLRVEKLYAAATAGSTGKVAGLMRDVVGMCRGGQGEN